MIVKIPVEENDKIIDVLIEAKDVFEAMKIARKQKLNIIADYVAICWHNGQSID